MNGSLPLCALLFSEQVKKQNRQLLNFIPKLDSVDFDKGGHENNIQSLTSKCLAVSLNVAHV